MLTLIFFYHGPVATYVFLRSCGQQPDPYEEFRFVALASTTAMSATFLYRCPVTGYRVQGLVADNPTEKNGHVYEALTCVVCKRIHVVDPKTGKVLGSDDK